MIFFYFLSISDFLCRFASIFATKKSKNTYCGKNTVIIRWPPRWMTALQVVRTSFLGPRPRLFPPCHHPTVIYVQNYIFQSSFQIPFRLLSSFFFLTFPSSFQFHFQIRRRIYINNYIFFSQSNEIRINQLDSCVLRVLYHILKMQWRSLERYFCSQKEFLIFLVHPLGRLDVIWKR